MTVRGLLAFVVSLLLSLTGSGAPQQTSAPQKATAEIQKIFDDAQKLPDRDRLKAVEVGVSIAEAKNDIAGIALLVDACGFYAEAMGEYPKALTYNRRALALYRTLQDRDGEASMLNNIGRVFDDQGEKKDALDYYKQALPIWKLAKDSNGEAATLNNLGALYTSQGKKTKALLYFESALVIERKIQVKSTLGPILIGIGSIYDDLGNKKKALQYYREALSVETDADKRARATTLNDIGKLYDDMAQKSLALSYYDRSLAIFQEIGDPAGEAMEQSNGGACLASLGKIDKALDRFSASLTISRKIGYVRLEANILNDIGETYSYLGFGAKSTQYLKEAAALFLKAGDRHGFALAQNNLGVEYQVTGRLKVGEEFLNRALEVWLAEKDPTGEAMTLNNLAALYGTRGQKTKALTTLQRVLSLQISVGDRQGQANSLSNIGEVLIAMGHRSNGLALYRKALPISREVEDRRGEAAILCKLAHALAGENPSLAVWYYKRAVNLCQSLRNDISSLDPSIRRSYKNTVANSYRNLAALLAKLGRIGEAEQVLLLLKDDELDQFVRRSESPTAIARAEYTPAERTLDKEYELETQDLVELGRKAEELQQNPEHSKSELKGLTDKLNLGEAKFQNFLDRVLLKSKSLDVKNDRIERIRDAEGIANTLAKFPKGTVAVYALSAPDSLRLFFITSATAVARTSTISAADLNRKVLAFRQALTDPSIDPRPLGQEFYDLLIGPIAKDLKDAKAKRIMWSLDGQLRYIPLAALYDGQQFLVEKYDLSIFTPAGSARLERDPATVWHALAAGVSLPHSVTEYDGVVHQFAALGQVPRELAGVMNSLPGSTELLDDKFTLDGFEEALGLHPNLVHLATHFSFRPGDETRSYLLTGDGKPLRVSDARSLSTFSFRGVSLLTLSACETALGGSDGSEVEDIAAVLQKKGAEAVIATLWSVSDSSTAALMTEFYRLRTAHSDWSKLHALQAAQIALLQGRLSVTGSPTRSESVSSSVSAAKKPWSKTLPRYYHPYYWAPFVLMGNWK